MPKIIVESFNFDYPYFGIYNKKTKQRQEFKKNNADFIHGYFLSNDNTIALFYTKNQIYLYDVDI
jgi:hypothetical protein